MTKQKPKKYAHLSKPYLLVHRLITDAPAELQVDHINGNGLDNRESNLRLATNQENQQNKKHNKNCKSGIKGVHWYESSQKWRAVIRVNQVDISLGYYYNIEDAIKARELAVNKYHPFADPSSRSTNPN